MSRHCFLDIGVGDRRSYTEALASYDDFQRWLARNGAKYNLPSRPEELDSFQVETLDNIYPDTIPAGMPTSLVVGRLIIELEQSAGLAKTRENFISLCRGDKGMAKNAPNKRLHYLGCPIHRIVEGYIAQGGDVTRHDGSGGESIYGGKFNDEKEGLKVKAARGSLVMANSGKNSNTSQFFVVLTSDPGQLKKIQGKYVIFGKVVDGLNVLDKLNAAGSKDGTPKSEVWIENCGEL